MKQQWDERYSAEEYIYGTEPNEYLKQQLALLQPGRILFAAEGEGRNAVYAAGQGWNVSAFDQSAEGMQKALKLAASKGVAIDYQVQLLEQWQPEPAQYDCIVFIFVHLPEALRKEVHRKAIGALRSGGAIILEAFSKKQLPLSSGGPKMPELLYDAADLQADFAKMKLLHFEETQALLLEGRLHNGPAEVIRLTAIK